jgi:hypothetical protein
MQRDRLGHRQISEPAITRSACRSACNIRSDATSMKVYGPDYEEVFRTGAAPVSRKSKGAKPGDLSIEQPTKF